MQLKTLGESTSALSKLEEALQKISQIGNIGMPQKAMSNKLLIDAFSEYSIDATKMALAQSKLNENQIKLILSSKGLKDEILETTTADLANAASVNAVAAAEKKATASTIGFGAAVKGLGVALKNLVIAHPIVATITVIGTAIALYAQFGNTLKNLQKKAKESKQEYDNVTTEIKSLNDELKTTKDRIEELQNKDVLTIVEQEELDKLKETNDELERELRIKETIAQRKGQDAADKAQDAITKKSESYNGHYAINDPDMTLQDNPYVYDKGDRIDAANWDIEQAKQNNQELEALYEKRREIEEKYNNDASQFQDDKEWKNNKKNIESKKAYIESVEDSASAYIEALMDEDDALYDSNGKIIKGKEELVNKLLDLYKKFDEYNSTETPDDKEVFDKYYNDTISSAQEKYGTDADWESWFDENVKTKEEVDKWLEIQKACDDATEAKKKYLETPISKNDTSLDLTSQLTESDDKGTSKATLADLRSEADLLKTVQKEMSETGKIGISSMQSIIKQYPEAKEALSEYVAGIINEQELFAQLENVYNDDKTQYVNAVLEKVQADEEFFSSLKTGYPEVLAEIQNFVNQSNTLMEQAKESYINSIVAEEETCDKFLSFIKQTYPELYNELAEIYGNDKENFIRHIIAENETNKDFIDSLRTAYPDLANALATVYGNDVSNWTSMEQAKAQITANLINQLNAMWAEYFDGISETFGAFGSIMENADGSGYTFVGGQDDSHSYDHNLSDEENKSNAPAIGAYNNVKNKIQAAIKVANQAVSDLQGAAYDKIESSVGGLDWNDLGTDSSSSSDSGSDSSSTTNPKDYDLIERKIKKLESAISNLDTAVSDAYTSWGDRNSALADELSSVADEISLQQQAYEKYMDLANSVGLDEYYQDLIKNGAIDVITVDDENLQDQIDKFQDFYDKAQDCNDKIKDLNQNLKELQKTKFDNVVSQFEDITSSISHAVTMLDKYIDLADKHSYYASTDLYEKQIGEYNNTLNTLTNERNVLQTKLQESVQSGLVQEGSEAWSDMLQQIQSVNEEIVDTIINIQEVENSLRDLDFTKFERGQDNISDLTSEAQFYIDLIEKMNKDLYDEDGAITSEGFVTQALHAQNYGTYLKQADFYANKLSEIETELANDPANTTLIDKKQEYIEAQRESVLAAYEEKNAIIDLIKDGYDKASDALAKLIDKRKEALEAEKDLHDYQKSVQEKSDKVTELEKQKNAYANDASEEAKSKVQQLEVNLKEAQEDLAETEYDKYISDQEKLLDDLQEEYEQLINERIDNIDSELGNIADAVNYNRQGILDKLEELSHDTELPLTRAMEDIWISAEPVANLNATVKDISGIITGTTSSVDGIIARLDELISIMHTKLDEEINKYDDGSYNSDNSNNYTPTPTPSYEEPENTYSEPDDSDSDGDNNYDDIFEYKHYYSQPLNIDTSVVDRLKYNDINAAWDKRADYYNALFGDEEYTGSDTQNIRMLDWLKEHGYAKGKKRGEYSSGLHPVGENGNEIMIDGVEGVLREVGTEDTIFTNEMTKNLAELAKCYPYNMPNVTTVLPSPIKSNATQLSNNIDNIEIVLPNVKNYPELKRELMNDRNFKKFMSETVVGQALGHNELAANKYK